MLHSILSLVRGYDTRFSDLEILIFEQLKLKMPSKKVDNLEKRIASINRIYRIDGGREVLLYDKRRGNVNVSPELAISAMQGVCRYANFSIKSKDEMTRNTGKIILVDGIIFSIEYRNPTEHCDIENIEQLNLDIVEKLVKESRAVSI